MLYSEAKRKAAEVLLKAGIEEAQVDAEYLLLHVSGLERNDLFMRWNEEMPGEIEERYRVLTERRSSHEPLQYIIGNQDFMGYTFIVTPDVLIPRFDTEILAEHAIKRALESHSEKTDILDLCTGSGCVATSVGLSLYRAGMKVNVTGADISPAAVELAEKNWELNAVQTEGDISHRFIVSDLFKDIEGRFRIITANPPYIVRKEIETLMPEITEHEPHLALDGGDDGMDFYRRIVKEAPGYLLPGGRLLMEFDDSQAVPVAELMREAGFTDIEVHKDLAGLRRVIEGIIYV